MPAEQLGSVRGVHINQPLTNFSLGYHPTGFVAEQVFPVVPVKHESDDFLVWDKGQAFRVGRADGQGSLRADGAESQIEEFGGTWNSYRAEAYARKTPITDRQRQNADPVWQLEQSKTRRVMDKLLLDQELRVAGPLLLAANYAASNVTTLSGVNQWNNTSFVSQQGTFSVIEEEVDNARKAIRASTGGLEPNVIIIPIEVGRVMKRDIGIREAIKFTHPDILTKGTLPDTLWGLKVVTPSSMFTTQAEGETIALTDVWGKNVIVAYVDPSPSLDTLTLGSIFRARPFQVKQWYQEERESTWYEPSVVQDEMLVSADCGYLMQSVIA